MREIVFALFIFICLSMASLSCLGLYEKLPIHHRGEDTHNVVRLAASVFVVMTSLVLGLLINSVKDTFEAVDRDVHTFATELVILDRTLRLYGAETNATREYLITYAQQALDDTWSSKGGPVNDDRAAEHIMNEAETAFMAIKAVDMDHAELWREAQLHLQRIVELRWTLIGESSGRVSPALVAILIAWLMLIFASFGYRAPRNPVVITTLVLSAFLISCSLYLVLDMDTPFSKPIQVSPAPLKRAVAYMRR